MVECKRLGRVVGVSGRGQWPKLGLGIRFGLGLGMRQTMPNPTSHLAEKEGVEVEHEGGVYWHFSISKTF